MTSRTIEPSKLLLNRALAGGEVTVLLQKFPPRARPTSWPETTANRERILLRVQRLPGDLSDSARAVRAVGARFVLSWLETFPGETWQQRWQATGADMAAGTWHELAMEWGRSVGRKPSSGMVRTGLLALISVDVVRPAPLWFAGNTSRYGRPAIAAGRDPEGFAQLEADVPESVRGTRYVSDGLKAVAQIVGSYGGKVRDIVVGDFLVQVQLGRSETARGARLAYSWLREQGQFPPDAPSTLLMIEHRTGQVGPAELVDRYHLKCQPIRDLLVAYLTERQPALDYNSLKRLSSLLAKNFWADLEQHHPGIDSLHLPLDVSEAWKVRLATKTVRRRQADGTVTESVEPRSSAVSVKLQVRAFYLDIAQWALDEPERWGQWAAPVPISEGECSDRKLERQQKSRKDQRTRERLPVLPTLVRVADRRLKEARLRLEALYAAAPGATFTVLGETFTAPRLTNRPEGRPASVRDDHGRRRLLATEEKIAFWAWATIEIFQHTGIRIEELRELGHHSIISYKLPSTGQVVPLLQIAPSKTDQERLLLISPELADVLSAIVSRVRGRDGSVPLVSSYDQHEGVWNPPMPLLYQWHVSSQNRPLAESTIRKAINQTLEATGLTDSAGKPLTFQLHDFRRIFITDAILSGLPPHIAQVVAGHNNINSTMGYAAIYPVDAIESHRAFIARRRALRPVEEYRAVTPEEWNDFLGHFEKRKLALGSCGRAYGTDCVHEHACVRCPVLIVDFGDMSRLVEIRENLTARIGEAEREGWLGEVEGLSTSLAATQEKISQIAARQERKRTSVFLGIPKLVQAASCSSKAEGP
ncbi:site-specific integrase [Streptomyces phaeochromogenes]|uniref:site-specific integrase n=1 Tax=Streptomyces phaeochromogenes TaxID=1923 RepID=UPI0006E2B0BE|nr:site-specific integrase [Streptomyces phaeochromogenes]